VAVALLVLGGSAAGHRWTMVEPAAVLHQLRQEAAAAAAAAAAVVASPGWGQAVALLLLDLEGSAVGHRAGARAHQQPGLMHKVGMQCLVWGQAMVLTSLTLGLVCLQTAAAAAVQFVRWGQAVALASLALGVSAVPSSRALPATMLHQPNLAAAAAVPCLGLGWALALAFPALGA
jgi:hypothetical protein